ncbi:MAG: putative Ig domain-containing protein [Pseudomonadota bacterium]
MNRKSHFAVALKLCLMVGFGLGATQAAANLINDPSFEGTNANWQLVDATTTFVSSPVRTGSKALSLLHTGDGVTANTKTVWQVNAAQVTPGQEYTYSVWIEGSGLTGSSSGGRALAVVRWRDANDVTIKTFTGLVAQESFRFANFGTYSYTQDNMVMHIQAPARAFSVDIGFRSWRETTGGTSYWDDVSLLRRTQNFNNRGDRLVSYEAEDADIITNSSVLSDHIDYTGTGYVDVTDDQAIIEWNNVGQGTGRTIAVRFSWEGNPRPIALLINGTQVDSDTPIPTGRRGTWASHIFTNVDLPLTNNTVRLIVGKTGEEKSQPMIDKIDIHDTSSGGPASAPQNVSASNMTFSDRVQLNWDPVIGASRYEVFRSTVSGNIGTLYAGVNGPEFADTDAAEQVTYYYQVKACNNDDETLPGTCSVLSSQVSGVRDVDPSILTVVNDNISNGTTVDLTALGASDWRHWALSSASTSNRKATLPAPIIPDFTTIGGANPQLYTASRADYTWSDGVPTASVTTSNGLRMADEGVGLQMVLPADRSPRTLVMYVGVDASSGRFTATLSDNSKPAVIETITQASGKRTRRLTINYAAASAGQTLTVSYVKLDNSGGIYWDAATIDVPNVAPVWTSIPTQTVTEGASISVPFTATDNDGPSPITITQTNTLPGSPTNILTDNGNGTGSINWTSGITDATNSPYTVTLTATDGAGASDSTTFSINVQPNAAPVITPISDVIVVDDGTVNVGVTATDSDGPAPITLSQANNIPGNPNILIDLPPVGDGDATIAWSPNGVVPPGTYQVTVTATDGDGAASSTQFNIQVVASAPPVLNPIGDQSVIEQRVLTVPLSASDSDSAPPLTFSATSNLPGNPSLITSTGPATANLIYTPNQGDVGVFSVTVTVTDTDNTPTSETFSITVNPNQSPSLTAIPPQTAVENQELSIALSANDPDGPLPIVLSETNALPGSATIDDGGSGTGTFRYTPAVGESAGGPYSVTITATDDDGATDTTSFTINVIPNEAPTLTAIGPQTVREQSALIINLQATDATGPNPLTLTQTNTLPGTPGGLINDMGDGTGTLTWTPAANDSNNSPYTITVTATDGEGLTATETFAVTVLPQGFGGTLTGTGGTPPDPVNLTLEGTTDWIHMGRNSVASEINRKNNVPQLITPFAPFNDANPFATNNRSDYTWTDGTPTAQDTSDNKGLRVLTINKGFQFSVPAGLSDRTLKVYISAQDAIGEFRASLSDASAPDWVNNITAPSSRQLRVFTITYAAGLPGQTLNLEFEMTTSNGGYIGLDAAALDSSNDTPVFATISDQIAVENQQLTFPVTATDSLPTPNALTMTVASNLPGNPTVLTNNQNGSETFSYTPAPGDAGVYSVSITATDADGEAAVENFNVTVAANTPPTLDPISDQASIEGQAISVTLTATDVDGPAPLNLSFTSDMPAGNQPSLTDDGLGNGTLSWTPQSGDTSGSPYTVTVTATDSDSITPLSASQTFQVTLTASTPPVLAPIGDLTIIENRPLNVALSATDTDGPLPLNFSDSNDIGQSLIANDNNAGSANLQWTPPVGASANSPYTQTVTISDAGGTTDSETISINVLANTPPTLNPIGDQNVVQNSTLFLTLGATDPDGLFPVTFSQTNTLPGSPNILTDNNNGSATVIWTAGSNDAANAGNPFSVTVTVTDNDGATAVETFTVRVTTSQAPQLAPIGNQNAVEQIPLDLSFSATDPDTTGTLVYSMVHNLPGTPILNDMGDGTATFSWGPQVGDAAGGPYQVTITVTDDGGNGTADSETFTVNVAPNTSPVLDPIGQQTAVENVTFTIGLTASDDGTNPVTFSQTNNLPNSPNILTDNGDNTATLSYMPGLDENLNSPYSVTITVTDENGTQDSETFSLFVVRGGRLTGSALTAPATVDLTTQGVDDWVHFGLGGDNAVNRKSGVPTQIPLWSAINAATPVTGSVSETDYSWLDGTPQGNATTDFTIRVFEQDRGFSLSLPASRSERIARIYVTTSSSAGVFSATLSDSSAPLFTTTIPSGSRETREITLVYRTGSSNQTIDLTWVKQGAGGFIALDAITLENLNAAPALPAIGDQTLVENQDWSVALNATDSDGPAPITISQINNLPGLPDILTDNGDGTGSLDWTPAVGDAGNYQITLTVQDGVGEAAVQVIGITVNANTPPTIDPIADFAALETDSISVNVTATDSDGPMPITLTMTSNDTAGTFTDNGSGNGVFSWNPVGGESANSPFTVEITAEDGDNATSTETFQISMTASLPPTLDPIGNQTVIEARTLTVPLTASDPENTALTFTDISGIGSSIIDNNDKLLWTPPPGSAGVFPITVTVTDASGTSDSETFNITVLADQSPVLAPIGNQSAFENAPFMATFSATDPDGSVPVVFTQSNNLPISASPQFTDNNDNTATLVLNAVDGDQGNYTMSVTVRDSFNNFATETFQVSITPSLPPVFTPIPDQTATEGQNMAISVLVTDSDGPAPLTITETNTLPGAPSILTDNGGGNATINWIPQPGDSFAGPYSVTLTATDGAGQSSTESFNVDVRRDGMLTLTQVAQDGQTINLTNEGPTDWVHWGLGGNSAIDRKSGVTAQISNFTIIGDANPTSSGAIDADYAWNDGIPNAFEGGTSTGLRVFDAGRGFQITAPAGLSERTLKLYLGVQKTTGVVTASITDGSVADATINLEQPSGKSSRAVTIVYKAGTNNQTLTVSFTKPGSGGWIALESAALVATNADPVIQTIADQNAIEGNSLTVALSATDDGPAPLTWTQTNNLPNNPDITLTDFGSGQGEIVYNPLVGDTGTYQVTVTATDAALQSSSETFNITIGANVDPTIVPIDDQDGVANNQLTVNVAANDVDGPGAPALTQNNNIPGDPVSLVDNGDGTGTITWTPAPGDAGNTYAITLVATDGVGNTAIETFSITVTASFVPVLSPIPPLMVIEDRQVTAPVSATDADGNGTITLSENSSTIGQSILTDSGSGVGMLSWTPPIGASANSPFTLNVVATDNTGESATQPVTITVVPNQAPVLASIGNLSATENVESVFTFTATDADGMAPPVLSATNVPAGAVFTPNNANGTATLTWTPGVGESGTFTMTVTATDGDAATDSETFDIVVTASNAPVIDPLGTLEMIETQLFTLTVTATDADGPNPLSWNATDTLPGTLTFIDNNDNASASLSYTPAEGENLNGPYEITLTVTDGSGVSATETVPVNVNRLGFLNGAADTTPSNVDLTAIGIVDWTHWGLGAGNNIDRKAGVPEAISNWSGLGGLVTATTHSNVVAKYGWSDGTPQGSASNTRTGAKTFTIDQGFEFTAPAGLSERQLRIYVSGNKNTRGTLSATLSDGSAPDFSVELVDTKKYSRVVTLAYKSSQPNQTLTVRWVKDNSTGWITLDGATLQEFNQAPEIATLAAQTVLEGKSISVAISATDLDGPSPLALSQTNDLPTAPTLTDNGDGTGTLTWTAGIGDAAGSPYTVNVTATDAASSATTEPLVINVVPDLPPTLTSIPDQQLFEQQAITLNLLATDDSIGTPSFTMTNNLPGSPILQDNGDGSAMFTWTAPVNSRDNSPYTVTITATDDAGQTTDEQFAVGVTASAPPVIMAIADQAVVAGRSLVIPVVATDPDGNNTIALSASTLANLAFTDNGNGMGTFTYMPVPGASSGSPYSVTVTATDTGGDTDTESFLINVAENQLPVLAPIGNQSASENVTLTLNFSATDADGIGGAQPMISATGVPAGAVFTPGTGSASLVWAPADGDSANSPYTMTVTATDTDGATASETFDIAVALSDAPVLAPIGNQTAVEDNAWTVALAATDSDGPNPLTFSETNDLPGNPSILTDNGDGTASLAFTPMAGDATGSPYTITVTVTDGAGVSDDETFTLTVNREGLIQHTQVTTTDTFDLTVLGVHDWIRWARSSATDVDRKDGVVPLLSGLTPINNPTLTRTTGPKTKFSWSDGAPTASITNNDAGLRHFQAGRGVSFTAPASPGLRELNLFISVQSGTTNTVTATLSDNSTAPVVINADGGSGTQSRRITITYKSATPNATLTVAFEKTGGGGKWISIEAATLEEFNQAPTIAAIPDQTVVEQQTLNLNVMAADADGPAPIVLTESNSLPGLTGSILTDNTDGSGVISYTPQLGDAANSPYTVTVTAADGLGVFNTLSFNVNVVVNQAPTITQVADQAAFENQQLTVNIATSDADGPEPTVITHSAPTLPNAATLNDMGDGTAVFTWTPATGAKTGSPYPVTITATDDDGASSTMTFNISVTGSIPPVLNAIANQSVVEGRTIMVPITATDADGNATLSLSASATPQPGGLSFNDMNNGMGTLTYVAAVGDSANSPIAVTVTATDTGGDSDSKMFNIAVSANQVPVIANIGNQSATENVPFSVTITASDADGLMAPSLAASGLPAGANFQDNGGGSATLSWTPQADDSLASPYTVTVTATDDLGATATQPFDIEVTTSMPPTIPTIGPQTAIEGQAFSLNVTVTDADGPAPLTLTATNTLPGSPSILTDNDNGNGVFGFTPAVGDSLTSPYSVTLTATDGAGAEATETFQVSVVRQGMITVAQAASAADIDLSVEGPTDWIHWAANNATQVNRKVGGGALISTWTPVGALSSPSRQSGLVAGYTWGDGDPVGSINNVNSGLKATTVSHGFEYTAPANIGNRRLKVYVSGRNTDGRLTVSLSDNSAPVFVADVTHNNKESNTFTIDYKSSLPNQTLIVRWEKTGSGGWITLDAAALEVTNNAPSINVIGDQTVVENRTLSLNIAATDADGPPQLVLSQSNNLPGTAPTFVDNTDGTATFDWTAGASQAGTYTVTVTAADGELASTSEMFTVTVVDNVEPTIAAVGNQNALEQQALTFDVFASDVDNFAPLNFSLSGPAGATLTNNNDGSATFSWTPPAGATANGPFSATVTVDDDNGGTATETFQIGVTESAPPVLGAIGAQSAIEGRVLTFPLSATDPDGPPTLVFSFVSTPALPGTAPVLGDDGEGTGSFTWTPPVGSAGTYMLTFTVADDDGMGTADTETITLTVSPNALPVINAPVTETLFETETLTVNLTATDSDGPMPIAITASENLPRGATFMNPSSGVASLTWDSQLGDAGTYTVTFTATDGQGGQSTQNLIVTVEESQAPTITPPGDQNVVEGQTLSFGITATDPDGPGPITLTQTNTLPGSAASFVDNTDGTGTLSWTSALGQASDQAYTVTFTATDGVGKQSSLMVNVFVNREGAISGQSGLAANFVDLSVVGTRDWAKWGFRNVPDVDRKAGVTPLISNYVTVNGAQPTQHSGGQDARYLWNDGTPTQSAVDSRSALRAFNNGVGFEFTVPAGIEEQELKVFLGTKSATGTLTATLSDGSAAPYSVDLTTGGKQSHEVTITFKASTENQTLTVRWIKTSGNDWIALEAAAMTGAPSLPFVETFDSGLAPGWIVKDESNSVSSWSIATGEYRQDNFVGFNGDAVDGAYHRGTISYWSGGMALSEYSLSVPVRPESEDGQDVGIMTRVDAANDSYQRLSFSSARGFMRLESNVAGVWETHASSARGLPTGMQATLGMQVQGSLTIATLDGVKLAGAYQPNLGNGTIGLYSRDDFAVDSVTINELPTAPMIAFTNPIDYNVVDTATFNVGAVVLNMPTGGVVSIEVTGFANACSAPVQMDTGYYTASCTVSGMGTYELVATVSEGGNVLDTHQISNVGVGRNVVTIGNSIVAGLDDEYAADNSSSDGFVQNGHGFEPIVTEYLNDLPAFEPSVINNEGVPGDTSARILSDRLTGVLERHDDLSDMVVMIGVNDAGGAAFTPSGLNCSGAACAGTFKGNMQAIIDQARAAGANQVIVPYTLPRFGDFGENVAPYTDPANNTRNLLIRDQYNVVINSQLINHTVGPDLYDLFLGQESRFYLYATNLHPNALGYKLIATELHNAISGANKTVFYVDNFCLKLSAGGNCETVPLYKQNILEPGNEVWVDDSSTLISAPSVLDNGRWLQTSNTDRNLSNTDYLSFDVPTSSKVYVAYDDLATSIPVWLSSNYTEITGAAGLVQTSHPIRPNLRLYVSNGNITGTHTIPAPAGAVHNAVVNYQVIVVEN